MARTLYAWRLTVSALPAPHGIEFSNFSRVAEVTRGCPGVCSSMRSSQITERMWKVGSTAWVETMSGGGGTCLNGGSGYGEIESTPLHGIPVESAAGGIVLHAPLEVYMELRALHHSRGSAESC